MTPGSTSQAQKLGSQFIAQNIGQSSAGTTMSNKPNNKKCKSIRQDQKYLMDRLGPDSAVQAQAWPQLERLCTHPISSTFISRVTSPIFIKWFTYGHRSSKVIWMVRTITNNACQSGEVETKCCACCNKQLKMSHHVWADLQKQNCFT